MTEQDLEEMKRYIEEKKKQEQQRAIAGPERRPGPCPGCGYCPICGRLNGPPWPRTPERTW